MIIEILEFVFRSFWTWLGSLLLIGSITCAIVTGATAGVRAFK